jgi:hypothetical protein
MFAHKRSHERVERPTLTVDLSEQPNTVEHSHAPLPPAAHNHQPLMINPQVLHALARARLHHRRARVDVPTVPIIVATTNGDPTDTPSQRPSGRYSDDWKDCMRRFTANDACVARCQLMFKDHYHCVGGDGCTMVFRSKEGIREHARQHAHLDAVAPFFRRVGASEPVCPVRVTCTLVGHEHDHCLVAGCGETLATRDAAGVFARLRHRRVHEAMSVVHARTAHNDARYAPVVVVREIRKRLTSDEQPPEAVKKSMVC